MEPDRHHVIDVAPEPSSPDRRRQWVMAIGALASVLFVSIATIAVSRGVSEYFQDGAPIGDMLFVALLLNMALILFAWVGHNALRDPVRTTPAEAAPDGASRDPLTGFLNRRGLNEAGAALLRFAARRGQTVAVLVLGIDHFRSVNDMHGTVAGDAVLRSVATGIAAAMPPAAITARCGGDEFACAFVFDPRRPDMVERVAEQLVHAMAQPVDADGHRCHVTCSVGVARSDTGGTEIDALLRSADIALFHAKTTGRNRFTWFDPAMERALNDRDDLESGLRSAIPAGQVVPWFEPQFELATGRLTGFEVLARWTHPTQGEVPPDRFIPLAEETGLIGPLSLSVIHQAFVAARDWDPGLSLSVNISPVQLRDAWLAQKIIKATVEAGFPPNRLEVEITESALFDNLALAQSIVGSLKNQGVRVALDDFGTGYSSLAHLRAIPFDQIKIDRSFVQSMLDSADSAAIVKAILGLGDSLNLPITAEGVESPAIAERLTALGCVKGQGWACGRPGSIADTRRMLGARGMLRGGGDPDVADLTSRRLVG